MPDNRLDEVIFTVPLWKAYKSETNKRAKRAVSVLKEEVLKRVKSEEANIVIDQIVNQKIWKRGIRRPPRKILVKLKRQEDGKILVTLP